MKRLAEMTWENVRELRDAAPGGAAGARGDAARRGVIAILPVGAIEAHGPHLPLETDVIIAGAMAAAGAARLEAAGRTAVVLPALAWTAAPFAAGFPGTISIAPSTVTALVVDIARGVAAAGIGTLAIANAHLDPTHLASLHSAVAQIRGETAGSAGSSAEAPVPPAPASFLTVVFPDLTRKPWAPRLGDEFKTGACHAGSYETSIVMAARPDLVDDARRRTLPANPASLSVAIRDGRRSFEEAGGPGAYFGWPADATADEGRRLIETLAEILAEAVG